MGAKPPTVTVRANVRFRGITPPKQPDRFPPSLAFQPGTAGVDLLAAQGFANTRRAYGSDWRHFTDWCSAHGLFDLPAAPRTVGLYLTAHADMLSVAP